MHSPNYNTDCLLKPNRGWGGGGRNALTETETGIMIYTETYYQFWGSLNGARLSEGAHAALVCFIHYGNMHSRL